MLNIEKLNQILENLESPDNNEALTFIEKKDIHMGVSGYETSDSYYSSGDGVQGESDIYARIFQVKDEENLYLAFKYETDSYGSDEKIVSVKFVTKKEEILTVFEDVNS